MATPEQFAAHEKAVQNHVRLVRKNGRILMKELQERLAIHDKSKLEEPEHSILSENFTDLSKIPYGTPEYDALLVKVKPALDAHYAQNRHHPEHWPNGINDMDLVDLLELLADWTAAVRKNKQGNIHRSIEHNAKRFGITPQLAGILTNTVERYLS